VLKFAVFDTPEELARFVNTNRIRKQHIVSINSKADGWYIFWENEAGKLDINPEHSERLGIYY